MPIGVPKVAYRMPGSRGGEWVDIYQRLTRERIIFMGSEIDDELANQIIGVLLVSDYSIVKYRSILLLSCLHIHNINNQFSLTIFLTYPCLSFFCSILTMKTQTNLSIYTLTVPVAQLSQD